jgi:hypothetical protein
LQVQDVHLEPLHFRARGMARGHLGDEGGRVLRVSDWGTLAEQLRQLELNARRH